MITINNLTKKYVTNYVLRDINLHVNRGEAVAIIGPSGSGKTTLIRTVNGFVRPDSGTVSINNNIIDYGDKRSLRNLRKKVGMIYQLFNLVERCTVMENVLTGALGRYDNPTGLIRSVLGFFRKEDYERAKELLRYVDLEKKINERVDRLSGGEKQRVAIARALMQDPYILLADEPIANLDPKTSRRVMDLLLKINEEREITLLCVLHHVETVENYFSRVVALNQGMIIYDGPVSHLNKRELLSVYERQEYQELEWKVA